MSKHPTKYQLLEFVDGNLEMDLHQKISDHLLGCELCAQVVCELTVPESILTGEQISVSADTEKSLFESAAALMNSKKEKISNKADKKVRNKIRRESIAELLLRSIRWEYATLSCLVLALFIISQPEITYQSMDVHCEDLCTTIDGPQDIQEDSNEL